jgi:hypothetical protein
MKNCKKKKKIAGAQIAEKKVAGSINSPWSG